MFLIHEGITVSANDIVSLSSTPSRIATWNDSSGSWEQLCERVSIYNS